MSRRSIGDVLEMVLVIVVLGGCGRKPGSAEKPAADSATGVRLANPASKNCVDKGGTLAIEQDPTRGQFGVCTFPENHQCEEWALLRGDCPVGGIRVTGYVTPAARFCGITGGEYATTGESNTSTETGTCLLPSGETCDADAYFRRTCPAPKSESGIRVTPSPRGLGLSGNPRPALLSRPAAAAG